MTTTASTLIERSATTGQIVTADWSLDLHAALDLESDDGAICPDVVEFWGTDEDGREWRVHLRGTRRVEGGEPGTADYDTGRVISLVGDTATVAWDTEVVTPAAVDSLREVAS